VAVNEVASTCSLLEEQDGEKWRKRTAQQEQVADLIDLEHQLVCRLPIGAHLSRDLGIDASHSPEAGLVLWVMDGNGSAASFWFAG
jgi:hypothetical protein